MAINLEDYDDEFQKVDVKEEGSAKTKGTYEEVPDGEYQVKVERVSVDEWEEKLYMKWGLIVIGGKSDCIGRWIFKNTIINNDTLKWIKTDLSICGVHINKISALNDPTIRGNLLDVKLLIKKKPSKTGKRSNVFFVRKLDVKEIGDSHSNRPDDDIPF